MTLTQPVWIPLADALLSRMRHNAHPALTLLHLSQNMHLHPRHRRPSQIPTGNPLSRMIAGLGALGPVETIGTADLQLGPSLAAMPLWNNPLLQIGTPPPPHPLAALAVMPGLYTIADLCQLRYNCILRPRAQPAQTSHAIEFLWRSIPQRWREVIPQPEQFSPLPESPKWTRDGPPQVIKRLGWRMGSDGAPPLQLTKLTVRQATSIQTKDTVKYRTASLMRLLSCTDTPPTPPHLRSLRSNLAQLWDLPWEPYHKETFWRLINNGISGAGGHDTATLRPCPCGWNPPPISKGDASSKLSHCDAWREHAFWSCHVAKAILGEIDMATSHPTNIHHLWLLHPHPSVHPTLWLPVAAAALTAINHGRMAMYAIEKQLSTATTTTTDPPPPPHTTAERAAKVAISRFWIQLQDFADSAELGITTPAGHPFFAARDGQLSLHLPLRLPTDLD